MADTNDPRSLEMRVAAIEDKLSKMSISEQDLQAYQRVASLMAASSRAPCIASSATSQSIIGTATCIQTIRPIQISIPVHIPTPIIINDCIQAGASGAVSPTGFGSLGQ